MGVHVSPHPKFPYHLPPHPISLGFPSAPALSSLFHASNLDWSSISHMVIYIFQCCSLKSSHLALSHRVQKSVLCICVFFAVSHIGFKFINLFCVSCLEKEDPLAFVEELVWWCSISELLLVCKAFDFSFIFE